MADDNKTIFDGSAQDEQEDAEDDQPKGKRPILSNDSQGAAAWLHHDKNGNAYLSIKLPLALGSLNLFPSNDTVEDALNQLADYLDEQEE